MKKLVNLMLIGTLTTLCSTGCTALIAGGVIGAGATVAADSRTAGAMVDDESIEIKSGKYLSNNREIYEKSKLEATSVNGNVLLTGQCLDQEYIDYIVQRVSAIPKVKRVINRIEKIPSFKHRWQDSDCVRSEDRRSEIKPSLTTVERIPCCSPGNRGLLASRVVSVAGDVKRSSSTRN